MGTGTAKRRRPFGLDFRATADDAWWLVQLRPERRCAVLRVSCCGFTEAADERFEAEGFRTLAEVDEFRARFRPTSVQLQDSECKLVVKGMEVSVSHQFGENEVRFYSAVVEEARTPKTVTKHTFGGPHKKLNCEKTSNITHSSSSIWREGKKSYNKGPRDLYLGSSMTRNKCLPECYYFFQIRNLEKDISPACITEFLLEQTSISSVVIILPALSSKYYSTATIYIETKEKAEKLSEFLFNPEHIIMSVQGSCQSFSFVTFVKPWVLSADWQGSIEGKIPEYERLGLDLQPVFCGTWGLEMRTPTGRKVL